MSELVRHVDEGVEGGVEEGKEVAVGQLLLHKLYRAEVVHQ